MGAGAAAGQLSSVVDGKWTVAENCSYGQTEHSMSALAAPVALVTGATRRVGGSGSAGSGVRYSSARPVLWSHVDPQAKRDRSGLKGLEHSWEVDE